MSHNVRHDAQHPTLPILTVKPTFGKAADILFSESAKCISLHPWNEDGGEVVRIEGEDLYAFRELLNELPEEAFVRPADPEPESYYVVDRDGHGYVYLPDWDGWRNLTIFVSDGHEPPRHSPHFRGFEDGLAELIRDRGIDATEKPEESYVVGVFVGGEPRLYVYDADLEAWDSVEDHANGRHVDVDERSMIYRGFGGWKSLTAILGLDASEPKPRWSPGDIVEFSSLGGSRALYTRGPESWTRTFIGNHSYVSERQFTDDEVSGLVDGTGYNVVRQANA